LNWACDALCRLVEEAKVRHAETIVLYESPTAIVEFRSSPAKGNEAIDAARLSLRDSVSTNQLVDPEAIALLGKDRSGPAPKAHTLAATDTAINVQEVYDVAQRAGLRVEAMAPISAATIAAAVKYALSQNDDELLATLRVDDEHSALVVSSLKRLHLLRPIELGVNRLVEALVKPIENNDRCVMLERADARQMLVDIGIPDRDQVVDAANDLTGVDVLPLLQPTLQRLVVELKQSLRFGLNEKERKNIRLTLEGPGASIPGLAKILSVETGIDLTEESLCAAEHGALAEQSAVEEMAPRLNLVPISMMKRRMRHRIKTGILTGAGIAVALLAMDAGWSVRSMRQIDQKILAMGSVTDSATKAIDRQEQTIRESVVVNWTASRIAKLAPRRVNWGAWLEELARRTPDSIQIRSVSADQDGASPTAVIEAVAVAATTELERDVITKMVESLRDCPLVESAQLGAVQRDQQGDYVSQEFRIVVSLVASPVAPGPIAEASP